MRFQLLCFVVCVTLVVILASAADVVDLGSPTLNNDAGFRYGSISSLPIPGARVVLTLHVSAPGLLRPATIKVLWRILKWQQKRLQLWLNIPITWVLCISEWVRPLCDWPTFVHASLICAHCLSRHLRCDPTQNNMPEPSDSLTKRCCLI